MTQGWVVVMDLIAVSEDGVTLRLGGEWEPLRRLQVM